jgi:HD-GYP domain-containing protein (c-di-GMP phosphodiesterase class II)
MFISTGKKWSFRISLVSLMITLILSLSAAFLMIARSTLDQVAEQSSDQLFREISGHLVEKVDNLLNSVESATEAGAFLADTAPPSADVFQGTLLPYMINTLQENSRLHALFWEDRAGTLVRMVSIRGIPALREWYGADEKAAYVVRVWDRSGRIQAETHFDATSREIVKSSPAHRQAVPMRPWRNQFQGNGETSFSGPYVFGSEPLAGITCTKRTAKGQILFGADTTLAYITDFLWDQKVSRFGYAFLFDREGSLLAHPREPSVSVIRHGNEEKMWFMPLAKSTHAEGREIWRAFQQDGERAFSGNLQIQVRDANHIVRLTPINHRGLRLIIAVTAPASDFTSAFLQIRRHVLAVSMVVMVFAVITGFIMATRVSHALSLLAKSAQRVQLFDFSERERIESVFLEIHTLIQSFTLMRTTIRQRTEDLLVTQSHLKYLVDTGIALSGEPDDQKLIDLTFDSARHLANADGGFLYRADEKGVLQAVRMQRTSRGVGLTRLPGSYFHNTTLNLQTEQEDILFAMAKKAVDTGTITSVTGYEGPGAFFELTETFGPFETVLFVPLKTGHEKVVGLLQMVKPPGEATSGIDTFDSSRYPFLEVLAAQAAIAMDNQNLIEAQQRLMDSFIKVIAGAIDAKSPHTGRHCSRVPELALLLAGAAHEVDNGPLASFRLDGEDAWREFEIAAWLHDCGKLTTPDFVVNKATKLETRYNRIHEIRMRFEILHRDREIQHLRAVTQDRRADGQQTAALETVHRQLEDDFAFVARCNAGGVLLDQTDKDRLRSLAATPWISYFNDRLGLSEEELAHYTDTWQPRQTKQLLADRPEHLIPFDPDNNHDAAQLSFNLRRPPVQFNHGEMHNLLVEQGTLTEEERFAVQDHIIQTIQMLEQLPFPEHLARVPEYACCHHEKCNGTGYPRGLTCKEMSVPARILAIADIFEALTAADRPYKSPMSVPEALTVMHSMCRCGEIDPDLFLLFEHSKIIEHYGRRYLRPEQRRDDQESSLTIEMMT